MPKRKDVLTTGQVAKLCNVAPRTVSKWFDSGQLRGYRIPGSKDRRIPVAQLIGFMKAHGMPLNGLETGKVRVLMLDKDQDICRLIKDTIAEQGPFDVAYANSAFEAGAAVEGFKPDVMIVDVSMPDVQSAQLCRDLRANAGVQPLKLVATSGALTPGQGEQVLQQGFDAYLAKPFDVQQLVDTINSVIADRI